MEAKSADNTRAKSFITYCRQYKPALVFRVSLKNVGENQRDATHEISLPLYLLWKIDWYWFPAEPATESRQEICWRISLAILTLNPQT